MFAVSAAGLFLCHRLKLPPIIGYLLAGFVIGPYGLGLVHSPNEVEVLAEVGVVLLLFAIGIEFSISDLLRARKAVLLGGALQVGVTIMVTLLLLSWFDFALNQAVFAGFLVALSSTAIVLRALQDRAELDSVHGRVTLSILIFQDIIVAPMMIFTPMLSGIPGGVSEGLAILILKGLVIVAMVVVLARYIVPVVLYQVVRTRSRELFLLSIVLICSAVAWATQELGLSLGLGAFLAGLVISESEYSHQALEGILPFKAVFTGFFFVSIGMLLDTSVVVAQPWVVLAAAVAVCIFKAIIGGGTALALGLSTRSAVLVGLALGQVGEFSFILSGVGLSCGLLDTNRYHIFLAVAVLTMATTPFVINIAPRLADLMANLPGLKRFKMGSYHQMVAPERTSVALEDHLIVVGFGINGRNIARAARSAGIQYVIVEMNPDTVKAVRSEGEPIIYGDATSRELLEQVSVQRARIVVIAISDPIASRLIIHNIRDLSRRVYIIVRTRFVTEMRTLYDIGANEVIPEEFETSVEIFTRVLTKYLVPRIEIEKFTSELRSRSYEMFRSLARKSPTLPDLQLNLAEIEISAIRVTERCPVLGQSLSEARLRNRFAVSVLAIMRGSRLVANPEPDERLQVDDVLYIIGSAAQCSEAGQVLEPSQH